MEKVDRWTVQEIIESYLQKRIWKKHCRREVKEIRKWYEADKVLKSEAFQSLYSAKLSKALEGVKIGG